MRDTDRGEFAALAAMIAIAVMCLSADCFRLRTLLYLSSANHYAATCTKHDSGRFERRADVIKGAPV